MLLFLFSFDFNCVFGWILLRDLWRSHTWNFVVVFFFFFFFFFFFVCWIFSFCLTTRAYQASHPTRFFDHRRRSRSILRFVAFVWIRRLSARSQLPFSWRLCRSRQAIVGNHMPVASLQNQISREFLFVARQSRVRIYQQNIRILRRMWARFLVF